MNPSEVVDIPFLTEPQKVLLADLQKNDQSRLCAEYSYAEYLKGKGVWATIRIRRDNVVGILYKDHICLTKGQSWKSLPPGDARLVSDDGTGENRRGIDEALKQGPVTVWVLRFATEGGIWHFAAWKNGENQDVFGEPHFFTDKGWEDNKLVFLNEPLYEGYGYWGRLLGKRKEKLGDVVYNRYPYSADDDFSWHFGDAEGTAPIVKPALPDCENDHRIPCSVCGWIHDSDLTAWYYPGTFERAGIFEVVGNPLVLMKHLHAEMKKTPGKDVEIGNFLNTLCAKNPPTSVRDSIGKEKYAIFIKSTGKNRVRIRRPLEGGD